MPDGKVRHPNHIIDQQACRFLQGVFPVEWVQRTMSPDYGIDIDLELFGYKEGKCVTLGEHVFLQVKGTETAEYGIIHLFGEDADSEGELRDKKIPVLKFSIEVPLLKLVERMGSAIPVLLTVVDLPNQAAYYICLNDYIRHVLPYQNPNFRNQGHVTIYIPTSNLLTKENNWVGLWYGKRAKLYGLFQEILTLVDDANYMNVYDRIEKVEQHLNQIVDSDAWSACDQWGHLRLLKQMIDKMLHNNLINDAGKIILENRAPEGADYSETMVWLDNDEDAVSAFTAARSMSCSYYMEQAKAVSSTYESTMRHIGLPTRLNWILSN